MWKMYFRGVNVFLIVLLEASQLGSSESDPHIVTFPHPPTLDVPEIIDIPSGSTLAIECSGIYELEWELPTLNIADLKYRYNTTEIVVESNGGLKKHKNILTLTQLVANDTGTYNCYYKEDENVTVQDNYFASTHVFVNDPSSLLLPSLRGGYVDFLAVHHGRKAILHCPSTNPNINVTLCKFSAKECELPPDIDVEYDATKGFIIPFPTDYFNGVFECVAQYGNFTQKFQYHLVFFEDTATPQPYIEFPKVPYHMVNSTFWLNCTVRVDLGTLIFMMWDYPNKIENSSHIVEKESYAKVVKKNSRYSYKSVTKELKVTDTQLSDAGKYRCNVIDHSNKSNSAEIDIKIYDWSVKPYINLTTDIDTSKPLEAKIGDKFKILVSIDAFPYSESVFPTWFKDGDKLVSDDRHEIQLSSTQASLVINSLETSDSGKYALTVKSRRITNSTSVILHVIDKPQININGSQKVYMVNKTYVLACHGIGYPTPAAWWKWKKIAPPGDKLNEINSWVEADISENQPNIINRTQVEYDGNAFAYLIVSAVESGQYVCSSTNRMGSTNKTVNFFITDAKDGFDIEISNEKPVVGDKVTIICKASSYYYHRIRWRWKSFFNASNNQVQSNISAAVPLPVTRTKYSLTVVKVFPSIKLQDSGTYQCAALQNNSSNVQKKTIALRVRGIREPQFNFTNMYGTSESVLPEERFEFICKVEGLPFPEITWFKNQEPFNISKKPGFELMDKSQKLVIHRVIENDAGFYECEASNRGGIISANLTLYVHKASPLKAKKITSTETSIIVVIVVIAILLLSLTIVLVKRVCKERKEKQEIEFFSHALFKQGQVEMYNPDLPLADQVELLPYDHRWEFPKERLKLGRTLGQGAFGRVVKAEAIGIEDGEISTTVAVKMLKERVDIHQRKALMAELKILIHLGHHLNIVNLLGAVTKNMTKGELMVVVEYCPYGNLRHYLLRKRSTFINQLDPTSGKVDPSICTLPGSPGIENIEKVAAAYESAFSSGIVNPNYRNQSIHYADLLHRKRSTSNSDCSSSKLTEKTLTTQLSVEREYSNSNNDPVQNGSYCKDSNSPTVKDQPVTTCDLLCFAFQCARGMEYLTSRKLIHRDLAARNVLLAEDNVVKICDFGLAKDCYKYSKYVKKGDGPLPIKWMAIESIRDKVFTSKSDVWSFGVLLWEFFTLGGNPYPGIDIDEGFYRRLKDGFRMEKPEYAPNSVYEIMENCWKSDPNDRPDFTSLAEKLGELLHESVRKYYVELNEPYLTMNVELLNNNDYLQMGSEGKADYVNVESPDNLEDQISHPYDNVGAVRPVDNGPVPKAPMEVVPMIQLEPMKKKEKGNKCTVPAPIPDLLTISPSLDISSDPDYLNMFSPKDCHNKAQMMITT